MPLVQRRHRLVLESNKELREKFLDGWFLLSPRSYNQFFEAFAKGVKQPNGKIERVGNGKLMVERLAVEDPGLFNEVWDKFPRS